MYQGQKLNWKTHIHKKRKLLELINKSVYWLLSTVSKVSTFNKILLYDLILKLVWTYVLQLWGPTKNSKIQIIQRFQNKVLRQAIFALRHVLTWMIHQVTCTFTAKVKVRKGSRYYRKNNRGH